MSTILPTGYLELDYIESTGAQYIQTEIQSLENDVIEISGSFTRVDTEQTLCGTHGSGYYRKVVAVEKAWNTTEPYKFTATAGAWNETQTGSMQGWDSKGKVLSDPDTDLHVFKLDQANNTATIDNTAYALTNTSNRKAPCTAVGEIDRTKMPLFCGLHDSSTDVYGLCYFKLYRAKFTHSGTLVGDFIPALRLSDHKPGLYDLISNTFFTNMGSGADFTYPHNIFCALRNGHLVIMDNNVVTYTIS